MNETDFIAKIFYSFYQRYYNFMLNTCKEAILKFPTNNTFKLLNSLTLYLTNRVEEGIRLLEQIREEQDVKLSSTIALMYGHKFLGVPNRDVFSKLDAQMKDFRKTADAFDFYHASIVLILLHKLDKASDYIEKAISIKNETEFLTIKGWILLMLKNFGKHNVVYIKSVLTTALSIDPKNLLAIIWSTECSLLQNDVDDALTTINQAILRHSNSNLPNIQKLKILFASQDWEQLTEAINHMNSMDEELVYAKKYEILVNLCKFARYNEATTEIKQFFNFLQKCEPQNVNVILENTKLFATISNKDENILKETSKVLENSVQNFTDNADVVVELGFQVLTLKRNKEASRLFKSATKIDESSFDALLGLSFCEFSENGKSEQLLKQVQYLLELKDAQTSLYLHLLQARISENSEETLTHLKYIFDVKTQLSKTNYYSDEYLLKLEPSFLLEVIKEYLKHVSNNKLLLNSIFEVINLITTTCPGMTEPYTFIAKVFYLKGELNLALQTLQNLAESLPSEAGLLMAQIQIKSGNFEQATQILESCISQNFKVRENPLYHYITGLVDKNLNNYADAIKSLTTALNLLNIVGQTDDFGMVEKASIYVELIDTLNIVGQTEEAHKILDEATENLRGTPEEARILLLSADNMLARKNVQGAIELLNKIKKTDSCYTEAKIKMAEILLKNRRSKDEFIKIYKNFVTENPTIESYLMLGDAYMTILEPDDALECYEKALKENPTDPKLCEKMGKALVQTHYFSRAVSYYKKAVKDTKNAELKLQLAELYLNLKEYEKGELVLLDHLEEDRTNLEDLFNLQHRAKLLYLLAKIQEKSGNMSHAEKSLRSALEMQNRVRKRIVVEQSVLPDSEVNLLIEISLKLGEMAISLKNNDQAVTYYKEGLNVSQNNIVILVALAKIYMQMNYLDLCQETCRNILGIEPENETASVLMADIAFRKVDFDMAQFHFTQLINKQPTNWEALIRLLEISRRMGIIEQCEEYLNMAEKSCDLPSKEPGLIYCKAYFEWHSGNLNSALKNFNTVRQDADFGQRALYNMIEICLNPDEEHISDSFMESDDIEYRDSRSLALKTADRLIKELKQKLESSGEDLFKCRLLTNFRLLATKEKFNIERALDDFVSIASQNNYKENIATILGMATAYTLLKQTQRAKNQLKRVVKNTWTFEDADYLEKCWLLLADQYIQSNKLEPANDLIKKVVEHNKACTKAFEYLGFISEKEHNYKEAAQNYQQAWKSSGKTNPGIGYKLAYCYMKNKRYPDAIDTAFEVLKLNPDYPSIKKDILDKCMNNLRI